MADIARVKRNIGRMIDQNAPESDIDMYIQSEGVTLEQLQSTAPSQAQSFTPETRELASEINMPLPQEPVQQGFTPEQSEQIYQDHNIWVGDTMVLTTPAGKQVTVPTDASNDEKIRLLREADSSFDEEVARRRGEGGRYGAFLNKGIAQGAGLPIDLATGLINMPLSLFEKKIEQPLGGSESLIDAMRTFGVDVAGAEEQPTGVVESAMEGMGEVAGFMLPLGAAQKGLAQALPRTKAGQAAQRTLESMATKPTRAIGTEYVAGAGAGAGLQIGKEEFPDSPVAQTAAQLTGGVTGALAPSMVKGIAKRTPVGMATRAVKEKATKAFAPFTKEGARLKAQDRLQELLPDTQEAIRRLDDPTLASLTPAQRIGNEDLLDLERLVIDKDAVLKDQYKKRSTENINLLQDAVENMRGAGSIDDTVQFATQRRERLSNAIDARINQASDMANAKIERVKPDIRGSKASQIVRNEIENAYADAKSQERKLWAKVPKDVNVDTSNTAAAFDEIKRITPKAQQDDIPSVINRVIKPSEESAILDVTGAPISKKTVMQPVNEMQGLRSKLLEESRIARAAGNYNKARISDEMADAILEDLGASSDNVVNDVVGRPLREALDYSRELNQKFRQGAVGKLLGSQRTGDMRIASDLSLGKTVGSGGVSGDVALQDLLKAADTPQLRAGAEQYIREQFSKRAFTGDKLNNRLANKFINDNIDILDTFPNVKQEISEAVAENSGLITAEMRGGSIINRINNRNQSITERFIDAPVVDRISAIKTAKDPQQASKILLNMAQKDATGKAVDGLRSGVVDHLIQQSTKDGVISGKMLRKALTDKRESLMYKTILDDKQIGRINQVARELALLEKKPSGTLTDISGSTPNKLMEVVARVLGARTGGKLSKGGASIQTANIMSGKAKEFVRQLDKNSADALLSRAILDEDLLKVLLTDIADLKGAKKADEMLNAWLIYNVNSLGEEDNE